MRRLTLAEYQEALEAERKRQASLPDPPAVRHTGAVALASQFGLYWLDNGWDTTMTLIRRYEGREGIFSVDDYYGMQADLRKSGSLPSAPTRSPENRYLLVNGKRLRLSPPS